MQFEIISFSDFQREVWRTWASLWQQSRVPYVFLHPAIMQAMARLPRALQPSHVCLGRQQHAWVFGMPLSVKNWRTVHSISLHSLAGFDHVAPLDTTDGTATAAFLAWLKREYHPLYLGGSSVSEDLFHRAHDVFGTDAQVFSRVQFRAPFLSLGKDADEVLGALGKRFRKNLAYCERRAKRENIGFRVVTAQNQFADAFERLTCLHALRFSGAGRSSKLLTATSQTFHKEVCARDTPDSPVVFIEAWHEDQAVGSLYGLMGHGRFHFFQHGFAPRLAHLSLGSLLVLQAIRFAIAQHLHTFDFLRGMDAYKQNWTRTAARDYLIMASSGSLGWAAMEYARWKRARRRYGKRAGTIQWIRRAD